MRKLLSALLYTGLLAVANQGAAEIVDIAALREGDMRKLIVHSEPVAGSEVAFTAGDGSEMTLAAYEGKYVVLNFWATWCAPCRKEMPMLSEIQTDFGGDDFEVVTIATGRNLPPAIDRFFAEIGVENLPKYLDPRSALARDMAVLGLPITLILDPNGQEIARMRGDAEWNGESARAVLKALLTEADS